MATGSGIDSQFGIKAETTYGTPVTVDRFLELDSETLVWTPNFREPSGLRPGRRFKRKTKLARTRESVGGNLQLQHSTRDMGLLWKMALFSNVVAPTALTSPATQQIHTPSDNIVSATMQIARPEPESKLIRAHTYTGVVCTGWELSVDDGETVNLQLDLDGQTESTAVALATASYPVGAQVFDFSDATVFKTGGTPATASGRVSITGGTQVPGVVTAASISGDNSLALERFGLGNAGLKRSPRINDFAALTGTFTAEYDRTTWYDPFKAGSTLPLQLDFVGDPIGASGSNNLLSLILPGSVIKGAGPQVGGPDLVSQTVEFEVYDDDANAPIQVVLVSTDPTATNL